MRICLIHATALAIKPVRDAFKQHWPEAELMNVLDDHLSVDRAKQGLSDRITARITDLADYGIASGAEGIVFTCSAFGPAIEKVAQTADIPVLKPNEAMFAEAVAMGGPVGLLASFEPSLAPMAAEFDNVARASSRTIPLETMCAPDAMAALADGDGDTHDHLLAEAAATLQSAETIMLAQFSTARAAAVVAAATGKHVLTSPDSAVRTMRRRLIAE